MNNKHIYLLTASLAGIGLGLFLYKALALGFPLVPGGRSDLWEIDG